MITFYNYHPLLSIFMYDDNFVNLSNLAMDVDVSQARRLCSLNVQFSFYYYWISMNDKLYVLYFYHLS